LAKCALKREAVSNPSAVARLIGRLSRKHELTVCRERLFPADIGEDVEIEVEGSDQAIADLKTELAARDYLELGLD